MKLITSCILLCFLLLALPAASQAQTTPRPTQTTVPTALPATKTAVAATREAARNVQLTADAVQLELQQTRVAEQVTLAVAPNPFPLLDPTERAPCGLPERSASFSSGSATFEMTADCSFSSDDLHRFATFILGFTGGGPYTINGNGHSIIGPTGVAAITVANGVTLNLNNVVIRSTGSTQAPAIQVNGGTLNARNVTFQDNSGSAVITAEGGAHIRLTNARFLDNRVQQGVVRSFNHQSNSVSINGAEFQNNRIDSGDSILDIRAGCLTLQGQLGFQNNPSFTLGGEANRYTLGSAARLPCPSKKKKEEEVRPTLTATARPRYAASYTALQTATGMTFEATYGLDSGVHFRQLDGAGIGVQSIIDAGYLAALDVYGYVEQGVEVCFPQIGRVIFLDARTIPRAITTLPATVRDGMTCVYLNSPGSLVLLPN